MINRFPVVLLFLALFLFSCSATQPGEMPNSVLRKIQTTSAHRFYDRRQRRVAIKKQIIAYYKIEKDKDPRIPPALLAGMKDLAIQKNPDNYIYQLFTLQAQKRYYLQQNKGKRK